MVEFQFQLVYMLREELDGKIATTTIGPTMMVATSGTPAANTPLAAGILTIGGGDTMLIPIVMEISVDERIVGKMLGVTITDEGKYQMLPWRKTSGWTGRIVVEMMMLGDHHLEMWNWRHLLHRRHGRWRIRTTNLQAKFQVETRQ